MDHGALTDVAFWDAHWAERGDDATAGTAGDSVVQRLTDALLSRLDLAAGDLVLEVGGAPGGYVTSVARRRGARAGILDSSPVGCEMARAFAGRTGAQLEVWEGDLFVPPTGISRARAVFSLGLIEHFADPGPVVAAHAALVQPGGRVVVGMPNFAGALEPLLRWMRPDDVEAVDLRTNALIGWEHVAAVAGVREVERSWVGGPTPQVLATPGRRTVGRRVLAKAALGAQRLVELGPRALREHSSARWSGYVLVTYERVG